MPKEAHAGQAPPAARATFGQVFAIAEFRALWAAQVLSVGGDQLARVALTLLVFDQTRSALLAAVTFAASVVPTFVGGIALAGLADRWPRREVMIVCDVLRMVLVAAMAAPGMPVGALVALLFVVTMISAPFTSARAALYPDILAGDRYVVGAAATLTTVQFAQVMGFAVAGAVVGSFGVRASLLADAATFAVSALVIRLWVKWRPAAGSRPGGGGLSLAGMAAGVRVVFGDPRLRAPMLMGWLAAFLDVHEGVAAPLAASVGAGALGVGAILAFAALGASAGALLFGRLVDPPRRQRWMNPLAVAACASLIMFALRPGLPGLLLILLLSGLLGCFQVAANAAFVSAAPAALRSQAFGVAQAGMSLGQGATMIAAGFLAGAFAPSLVIAGSGVLGTLAAVAIAASHRAGR